jgi:GNAT superfamily N-acetyltransferase
MYHTRAVTPSDLDLVCRQREAMFRDADGSHGALADMTASFRDWLRPRLDDGSYFGWITEHQGVPVAGLGMMVIDWPPHPLHPHDSRRGYILNVFVEPAHRGRGLATALMTAAAGEARRRGITFMILHATAMGRSLYEKLGWKPTSEMSLLVER